MTKMMKVYWLTKLIESEDITSYLIDIFNNCELDIETAYCLLTLYKRLMVKRLVKKCNKKFLQTYENRIRDAISIVAQNQKASNLYLQQFYNLNTFDWEKSVSDIYPVEHY